MPNGDAVHNQERRTSSNGFICSQCRWCTAALLAVNINGMAAARLQEQMAMSLKCAAGRLWKNFMLQQEIVSQWLITALEVLLLFAHRAPVFILFTIIILPLFRKYT